MTHLLTSVQLLRRVTVFSLLAFALPTAHAQTQTANIPTGSSPIAVAVNPVTNTVYIANRNSNNVTIINGANAETSTVAVGTEPYALAVNPVTNMAYVADAASNTVKVINGANNSTSTVFVGSEPLSLAVNPVTNKIYVANFVSNNVTVIDGLTNSTRTAYYPGTNLMYLKNDAGTGLLSPGITPGSSSLVSNRQCTLQGSGSSISTSGNTLTWNVDLAFSGTFTLPKNLYLYAAGSTLNSGWVQEGSWTP